MDSLVLSDNWTLQNSGEFIHRGLEGTQTQELTIPLDEETFSYRPVSIDLIRFDALCQFLNHIVLSDQIWVDDAAIGTWEGFASTMEAKNAGVVVPKAFKAVQDQWQVSRETLADKLCVNAGLKTVHRLNKRQWAKTGTVADNFISQLLWGGAGMLARADFVSVPYSPHPLRQSLFRQSKFMMNSTGQSLQEFVTGERLRIYRHADKVGFAAKIQLPPVAARIIQESKDLSSLVSTALELREEYREIRGWIGQVQLAINQERTDQVLKHTKLLQSVSQHLDSRLSHTPTGDTTVQLGVSWLKIGSKIGSPINTLKNKFGIRAEINRLVLRPAGREITNKLLRMLGEKHTQAGNELKKSLENRQQS